MQSRQLHTKELCWLLIRADDVEKIMHQIKFKNGFGIQSVTYRDTESKAEKLAEAYQSAGFKDVVVSVVEEHV